MSNLIFNEPVVLVGGGEIDLAQLQNVARSHPTIIAADGGANVLEAANIMPDAIIGDLDSLKDMPAWQNKTKVLFQADQNTTDFEKCLTTITAPLFLCFGFWGDDLGHSLATLHLLEKFQAHKKIIIFTRNQIMFATNKATELELAPSAPVSIYPLAPTFFKTSSGLKYPLDGLIMVQGTAIGTSNTAEQSAVTITPTAQNVGAYLTIVPENFWSSAVDNFSS